MKARYWMTAFLAVCFVLATMNFADARKIKRTKKFKHADKNKDGRIDAKEYHKEKKFEKRVKSKVDKPWEAKADKNEDGYVSPKEAHISHTKKYLETKSAVDTKWEKKADTDGDGKVSAKELRTHHLTVLDKNGNGKIDAKERHMFWLKKKSKVNTAYEKKYDADGNGYNGGDEAKEMLRDRLRVINTHGKAIVNSSLECEYDANHDSIIDREEAKAMMDAIGDK